MASPIKPNESTFQNTNEVSLLNKATPHKTQKLSWKTLVIHYLTNNPLIRGMRTLFAKYIKPHIQSLTSSKPEQISNWKIDRIANNDLLTIQSLKVALCYLQSEENSGDFKIFHSLYGGTNFPSPLNLKNTQINPKNEQDIDPSSIKQKKAKGNKVEKSSKSGGKYVHPKNVPLAKLSFFPIFVRRELVPNHLVCVAYDSEKKQLEIFDSQGKPLEELLNEPIENDGRITLFKEALEGIFQDHKFGLKDAPIESIISNSRFIQQDAHNCGVHVIDYIKSRMIGKSAEEIFETDKNTSDMEKIRKDLVENITKLEEDPDFNYIIEK